MTTATEIKAYLDSLGTLGTIRIGFMPATPNVMGIINEYGGQAPEHRYGVAGVGYEKPSIQILFRGEPDDYSGPRAKAEIAYRALAAIPPGALGAGVTTQYLTINPMQSPFPIRPIDDNRRHTIGFNCDLMKELSA
jgi:hypothetical protein